MDCDELFEKWWNANAFLLPDTDAVIKANFKTAWDEAWREAWKVGHEDGYEEARDDAGFR